jgi:hypothetical protein
MQQKTVSIQESIRVEIYNELLDFGNCKLEDGIDNTVYLAHTMEVIQKSQKNEAIRNLGEEYLIIKQMAST